MRKLKNMFDIIKPRPEILREVYIALYHRLPDSIGVSWERDGKYIVGTIEAGGKKFFTQGKGADDFVEMVNDAVYTMYDVPEPYRPGMKAYVPPKVFQEALQNKQIKESSIALAKS